MPRIPLLGVEAFGCEGVLVFCDTRAMHVVHNVVRNVACRGWSAYATHIRVQLGQLLRATQCASGMPCAGLHACHAALHCMSYANNPFECTTCMKRQDHSFLIRCRRCMRRSVATAASVVIVRLRQLSRHRAIGRILQGAAALCWKMRLGPSSRCMQPICSLERYC